MAEGEHPEDFENRCAKAAKAAGWTNPGGTVWKHPEHATWDSAVSELVEHYQIEMPAATGLAKQTLIARIKDTSKYSHQAPLANWFVVTFSPFGSGYEVLGNNNCYAISDLNFGVLLENGSIVALSK